MARNITTIYNEIVSTKEQNAELQALSSISATAIWRLWAWITAAAIFTVEMMHDLFIAEVESRIASLTPGTLLWYRNTCLLFRYGVALEVNEGRIGYPADDDTPPLIAQCSVKESANGLVIKIAKEVSGELVPLSNDYMQPELGAFSAFLMAIKYAGTPIGIINSNANLLKLEANIFYDPLLIKADGTSIATGAFVVEQAIETFLRNLPFDGRLKRSSLIEAIKAVPGVADAVIDLLQHKYEDFLYDEIPISHVPESGYFKIDPAYPLDTQLTYTVYV